MKRGLQVLSTRSRATFWRSLQALTVTRIVIVLVLLLYLAFDVRDGGIQALPAYAYTCFFYLGAAICFCALTVFWQRRFTLQLTSQIAVDLAVISLLYGGLVAIAQRSIPRLIAYTSVSHFGFIVLGIFVMNSQGHVGSTLYMFNHGLSTAGAGATFTVELPLLPADSMASAA